MSLEDISPNINVDHLHEIIRKKGGERMVSWAFDGAAGKKGDGYLSELYRLIITGITDKK